MLTSQQHFHNVRTYVARSDLANARLSFKKAVDFARTPADFGSTVHLAPALWHGYSLQQCRSFVLERIENASLSMTRIEREATLLTRCQLRLALDDEEGFMADAHKWLSAEHSHPLRRCISDVISKLESEQFPDLKSEKVFAIGLSRTGTTSIHEAFKLLGFNAAHFFNPISRCTLVDKDYYLFDAFSDTTICVDFERLFYRFPKSKFVFSTREISSWTRSIKQHMVSIRGTDDLDKLRAASFKSSPNVKLMYGDYDLELYFSKDSFGKSYLAFNERVESFFSNKRQDRFLKIDLENGDAWDKICLFLNRAKPNVPFPWKNASQS